MDTNMEDVGRGPVDLTPPPTLEPTTVPTVDGWIENLMNCKQLSELDVQRLCEKVRQESGEGPTQRDSRRQLYDLLTIDATNRHGRFFRTSLMSSRLSARSRCAATSTASSTT